jgi:nucleoid-associated protein YgaU
MHRSPGRLFAVLCLLVIVFIVTYWAWDPIEAGGGIRFETGPRTIVTTEDPEDQAEGIAVEPEPPGARVVPPEFFSHVVRRGEGWEDISLKYFQTREHAEAIMRANPFKSATNLREGDVVKVPLDPGNVQGKVVGEAPEEAPTEPPPPPAREYIVQDNDSLSEISRRMYGSTRHWRVILEFNRERLGLKDERSIRPGQVLLIPPLDDRPG